MTPRDKIGKDAFSQPYSKFQDIIRIFLDHDLEYRPSIYAGIFLPIIRTISIGILRSAKQDIMRQLPTNEFVGLSSRGH